MSSILIRSSILIFVINFMTEQKVIQFAILLKLGYHFAKEVNDARYLEPMARLRKKERGLSALLYVFFGQAEKC